MQKDDVIYRQAAIDALKHNQDVYSHNFHDDPIDKYTTAIIATDIDTLVKLPTIQPVATDTNAGDTISRQWLLECINDGWIKFDTDKDANRFIHLVRDIAPTVQPEVLACGNGELVAQPEPTDIDAREAVYNLAEKIGIHQLYALTVELRGEPIQPEPHKGHWIWVAGELMCSECRTIYSDLYPDYDNAVACPHCGCKMEVEHDSDLHAE